MKWNILFGTLVLGLGLSTQSYGFELLDRMLGLNNYGACQKDGCGASQKGGCCGAAQKGNGCADGCAQKGNGCCQKGDGKGACQKGCGGYGGCLGSLFFNRGCGCGGKGGCGATQKDGCDACQKGASQKGGCGCMRNRCRPTLFDSLFACNSCCRGGKGGKGDCGCGKGKTMSYGGGTSMESPSDTEAAPVPPAPVVDPSAYLPYRSVRTAGFAR